MEQFKREGDSTTKGILIFALSILIASSPCIAAGKDNGGPMIDQAVAEKYDGPKARIAVAEFEDKTTPNGTYSAEFGRGMVEMLVTSLVNTNRFIVLERDKIGNVMHEQNFGITSGRVKRETAAPIGELEGAELLVMAAVTAFDPGSSAFGAEVGGILRHVLGRSAGAQTAGDVLGNVTTGVKRAYLALDVRVVDTKTGRVVAANSARGSATDFALGGNANGLNLGGGLGGFAKTPMERAIREAIQASVDLVVTKTPQTYYRVVAAAPSQAPLPQLQASLAGQAGPLETSPVGYPRTTSLPPAVSQPPSVRAIAVDRNPKLTAEVTDARKRGGVVSITVTLRNPSNTKQGLELTSRETYLLDYAEGKKYELIGLQGQRKLELGPNEQAMLRGTFRAPQSATSVAIVIDDLGTFDDVALVQQ